MKVLETIEISAPCPAEWEAMPGDDRVRFCNLCQKSVYNLEGMTRPEAVALVADESKCLRLYRRADGTVLTSDCPVAVQGVRRRARKLVGIAGAGAALVFGVLGWETYRVVAAEADAFARQAERDAAQQTRLEAELEEVRCRGMMMGAMRIQGQR